MQSNRRTSGIFRCLNMEISLLIPKFLILFLSLIVQQAVSLKFIDCSGALVQTVSIEGCDPLETICRYPVGRFFSTNSIRYHVDFIANQRAEKISLEIALRSIDEDHQHYGDLYEEDDDDYQQVALIDDVCQGNDDVCPTHCHTLYRVSHLLDISNHTIFPYNQEINIQSQYFSENKKLMACFRQSIMLVREPDPGAIPTAHMNPTKYSKDGSTSGFRRKRFLNQ